MIYANLPIFGLRTLYFALLNLLSASFLFLPIFSKFHTALSFSNCLFFPAFTDEDGKEYRDASETAGNAQKTPRPQIRVPVSPTPSVRCLMSKNFCILIRESKDDQDMTLNSRTRGSGRETRSHHPGCPTGTAKVACPKACFRGSLPRSSLRPSQLSQWQRQPPVLRPQTLFILTSDCPFLSQASKAAVNPVNCLNPDLRTFHPSGHHAGHAPGVNHKAIQDPP